MHARSLMLIAPRRLEWVEDELPALGPHDVLVQTVAGAVSIGTEVPLMQGTARTSAPPAYPRMTGYESLGIVLGCGDAVTRLAPGDRVVAFYGHRTHAVVPAERAIAAPDGVTDAIALLAILTCDVAKGIRRLAPAYDEPVLVAGAGAIGLLTVAMLRALGLNAIDVVEPRPERRLLAGRIGARQVFAPDALDRSMRNAYARGFECSASGDGFALLQACLRHGGRVCVLSDGNVEPLTLTPAFHQKELTVRGSSDGWDYHRHAAWYFDLVRGGAHPLQQVFDLTVPATELIATFERLATGAIAPVKVLVRYDGPPTMV